MGEPKSKRRTTGKTAAAGSQAPSAEAPTRAGKAIFLFADGTGNSSAKLFKTNVWRMYEAVDLGLASPAATSRSLITTMASAPRISGRCACSAGFSGSASRRACSGSMGSCAAITSPTTASTRSASAAARSPSGCWSGSSSRRGSSSSPATPRSPTRSATPIAKFCSDHWPNRWFGRILAWFFRGIRDGLIHVKRRLLGQSLYRETKRLHTDIEFVGVWDTVAAYGGPFAEFTRGIDDWVWPLTMPHYGLSPKVKQARHALALDDERDAFQPLLWDEYREYLLVQKGENVPVAQDQYGRDIEEIRTVEPGRLKQVWFTGVHSDVGGGYPDESLSYISLLWMMDELAGQVDFIDSFVTRARDLANPYGPIHNSRSGFGSYYRYQPRKIAAMTDPPTVKTRALRDPEVSRGLPYHGLLERVLVHESAIARIISGIDNYAPSALPADFDIVRATGPLATPALTTDHDRLLSAAQPNAALREEHQENAWDLVWRRRLIYFLTVGFTLALVALPIFEELDWLNDLCSDDRCFAKDALDKALFFLPQSAREMLGSWTEKPLLVILLAIAIALLVMWGKRTEGRFRDAVRQVWRWYLFGPALPASVTPTPLRKVRESAPYQYAYFDLKWGCLPAVFGIFTLLALAYAAAVLVSQTLYALVEPHEVFCKDRGEQPAIAFGTPIEFNPADTCTDLLTDVEAKTPYRIEMTVTRPWNDGWSRILFWPVKEFSADPATGVHKPSLLMRAATPLKRVTRENWLQPVTQVRTHGVTGPRRFLTWLLGPPIDFRRSPFTHVGGNLYVADLCPRRDGHLYLMVNDAAPLLSSAFYGNNGGLAEVRVTPGPKGQACTPPIAARRNPG